jgi:hypothetical protein
VPLLSIEVATTHRCYVPTDSVSWMFCSLTCP